MFNNSGEFDAAKKSESNIVRGALSHRAWLPRWMAQALPVTRPCAPEGGFPMNSRFVARIVLSVGLLACAGAVSGEATACGDEVAPAVDHRIMGVARAERDLRDGKYLASAGSVIRMMPDVRSFKAKKDHALVGRAMRTLAVAVARGDGALALDKEVDAGTLKGWAGKTAEERAANLQWAASTMTALDALKKDDAGVKTDLAEVLSHVEGRQDEAMKMLSELAEKDLMTSAEGYAALARLRDRAGDQNGRQAAASKCEAMTKNAAICGKTAPSGHS
jgi:hypothetical protein